MDLHFADTAPDYVNAFAVTEDDPRDVQRRALAFLETADKRRSRAPQPRAYWEEPGHHGAGREVSLPRTWRGEEVTGKWSRKALRLPPPPKQHVGVGTALVVVGLVAGAGALGWYLWKRRRKGGSQVGADFDGLSLLGAATL